MLDSVPLSRTIGLGGSECVLVGIEAETVARVTNAVGVDLSQ